MPRLTLRVAMLCGALTPAAAGAGDTFAAPELLPLPAVTRPTAAPVYRAAPPIAPVMYPRMAAADPYAAQPYAQPAQPYAQPQPSYAAPGYAAPNYAAPAYPQPQMAYRGPYMTPAAPSNMGWTEAGPTLADDTTPPGQPIRAAVPQPPVPPTPPQTIVPPSGGPISDEMTSLEAQAFDPNCDTCDGGYGCDAWCDPCCPWFGSVGGLIMTRDRPNEVRLTCTCTGSALDSTSADPSGDWTGGYEVRFGRRFCGCWAWEVDWWQLDDANQFANLYAPGDNVSSALNFGTLNAGGTDMSTIYYGSRDQRVYRENSFQNLEINFLRAPFTWASTNSLQVGWLMGIRWFRFDENLVYAATAAGVDWGTDPLLTGFYDVDVQNNLIGPQVGASVLWSCTPRFSVFATPKFGIYGNAIEQSQNVYRGDGAQALWIDTYKADVSVLGQLDLGLNYRFTQCWSGYLGYRLIGVSGVALADNQIPQSFFDTEQLQTVDSNGSLLLHGVFAGVGYNY